MPLATEKCQAKTSALSLTDIDQLLLDIPDWKVENSVLTRKFSFADFHDTMAFVNATAWISNQENHHPDLEVGYNKCRVRYSSHEIGGISENDFICAAKVEELVGKPS